MLALYAEFTVKAGCESEVARLMTELTEQVRREPGNLEFIPYTREGSDRDYVVYEIYRDEQAFTAHRTSEHSRRFNQALTELIEGDASVLSWLTPVGAHRQEAGRG